MEDLGSVLSNISHGIKELLEEVEKNHQSKNQENYNREILEALKNNKELYSKEKQDNVTDNEASNLLECAEINKQLTEAIESLAKEQEKNTQELKILNRKEKKASGQEKEGYNDLIKEKQKDRANLELKKRNIVIEQKKNYSKAKGFNGNKDIDLNDVLNTKNGVIPNKKKSFAGIISGGMNKLSALKASPYFMAVQTAIKAVEWGIDRYTKYLTTAGEIFVKSYDVGTKVLTSTMTANLDSMKDAVEGQYSSGKAQRENIADVTNTINENRLAWKKFENELTNWIPIWGHLNKKEEAEMELKNKIQQAHLKRANEQLDIVAKNEKLAEEYINKQDKAIHNFQIATGMTLSQTNLVEKRLFAFGPRLAEMFNKTIEDVLKFQTDFINQSGRNMNMTNADYDSAMAMDRLIGGQNFSQFSAKMTLFNKSVTSSADIMFDTYKSLGSMGLSQQKVVKSILNNMRMAEKYSFKNGVQGYIDMVKWAENFRVNLSSISSAVDKMQKNSLEQVIQQSAKLQVLGGKFAMNSDPFAMYYESMNDAADYAKRIVDSFKGYGTINQKTGETEFSGNERKLIMEASSAWGVNYEDSLNMIRENNKKNVVKSQLGTTKLSGDALDSVINKSYYDEEKGQWMVNTIDGNPMAVADVGENDVNKIVGDEINDPLVNYAAQTFSLTDKIEKTTKEIAAWMGKTNFESYSKSVETSTSETKRAVTENLPNMSNSIDKLRDFNIKAQLAMLKAQGNVEQETIRSLEILANSKDSKGVVSSTLNSIPEFTEAMERLGKKDYNGIFDQARANGAWNIVSGTVGGAVGGALGGAAAGGGVLSIPLAVGGTVGGAVGGALGGAAIWGLGAAFGDTEEADFETVDEYIEKVTGVSKENWKNGLSQEYKDEINKLFKEKKIDYTIEDGFLPSLGMPISVSANKVVPINDGQVTTAVSHPQDSALFAKTGGPFDILFNGVFKEIDEIYHNMVHLPTSSSIYSSSETNTNTTNNGKFDLHLHGDINLKVNGQSYNIMGQLEKDPMFVRSITELICQQLSVNTNGGRNRGLNNRPTI